MSLAHFRNSKKARVAAAEGVARGDPEVDRGPITQRKQVCVRDLVFVWRAAGCMGRLSRLLVRGNGKGTAEPQGVVSSTVSPSAHSNGVGLGHLQHIFWFPPQCPAARPHLCVSWSKVLTTEIPSGACYGSSWISCPLPGRCLKSILRLFGHVEHMRLGVIFFLCFRSSPVFGCELCVEKCRLIDACLCTPCQRPTGVGSLPETGRCIGAGILLIHVWGSG